MMMSRRGLKKNAIANGRRIAQSSFFLLLRRNEKGLAKEIALNVVSNEDVGGDDREETCQIHSPLNLNLPSLSKIHSIS